MKPKKCKCVNSKIVFKKYYFKNRRIAYKSICTECGLVRGWYDGKNYRIVTGSNPKKGGDN